MKFPKFMKNETPKKSSSSTAHNAKLMLKTIYLTPDIQSTLVTPTSSSIFTFATPGNAATAASIKLPASSVSRHLKNSSSAQPKRLKRNGVLINKKFENKNETPVKAYLNAKRQQQQQQHSDEDKSDDEVTRSTITVFNSDSTTPSSTRSPLSIVSSNADQVPGSNSKLRNFVKKSFTNLHQLMMSNKSKSKLISKSNNCSSESSSDEATSPEVTRQQDQQPRKYPQRSCASKTRPVMGITALMLNNYKQQQTTTSTNAFTTTWPNMYLLGVPIVFNNNSTQSPIESNKKKYKTPKRNSTAPSATSNRRSNRRSSNAVVDANNNNTNAITNKNEEAGYKLEIYGTNNINESIRI